VNLDITAIGRSMGVSAALVLATIAFLFVLKWIDDRITPFDDNAEIRERQNLALALRRAGLYLGFVIALAGSIVGSGAGFRRDLLTFAADAGVILLALLIAQLLNGRLMLGGVRESDGLRQRNVAVGLVEFGQYIATGLILNGAINGEGRLGSAIMFAAVGQFALLLAFWLYRAMAGYDPIRQIREGNAAAGMAVGARLLGIGVVLWASITGDSTNLATDLTAFGIWFVFGFALLAAANWLADLLFLPELTVRQAVVDQRNLAGVVKVSGVTLAAAIAVAAAVAG